MQVYQTDENGFFVGALLADPDPLEPGNWLIPGGCVTVAPPSVGEGEKAQWTGGKWVVFSPEPKPEPEPEPDPTPEEIQAQITAAIDAHVEAQARAMKYNSAAHLAGYATSTVPEWAAEAQAFVAWRDGVWITALDMLETADPESPPATEDVIAALPEWTDP